MSWSYIGAVLANQSDTAQAEFLKGFIKECLTWGTKFQIEQQLAYVNDKLTPEERQLLGMLSYEEVTK